MSSRTSSRSHSGSVRSLRGRRRKLNPAITRIEEGSYLLSAEAPSREKADVWGSSRELWERHFLTEITTLLSTLSLPVSPLTTHKTYHLLLLLYFLSLLSSLAAALEFWMADSVLESESGRVSQPATRWRLWESNNNQLSIFVSKLEHITRIKI